MSMIEATVSSLGRRRVDGLIRQTLYLVAEFDVNDWGDGLLPGPEEGGPEADPQVARRHQVPITTPGHLQTFS